MIIDVNNPPKKIKARIPNTNLVREYILSINTMNKIPLYKADNGQIIYVYDLCDIEEIIELPYPVVGKPYDYNGRIMIYLGKRNGANIFYPWVHADISNNEGVTCGNWQELQGIDYNDGISWLK